MKTILKIFTLWGILCITNACKTNAPTAIQQGTCDTLINDVPTAKETIQGLWWLSAIYAGRAGEKPVETPVELYITKETIEVRENGKKTTYDYEIFVENGSKMLRMGKPGVQLYDENYKYFSGYLLLCNTQLRVGMGPVDGTDYVYGRFIK